MATFGECHKFQAFPVSLEAEHLPNRSDSWYNRTDRGSVDLAAPNPCLLLRIWLVYMPPVHWLLPMATFGECHKFQAFPVSLEAEHLPNRSDSWYNRTDRGSVDLAAPNPCLLLRIWLVYMPPVRWLLPMATFGECHKFQAFPVSLEAEHLPNRSDSWYNRTDRGSVDLAAPNPCLLLRIWLVYMPPVRWLLPMATFGECHKFQAFPVSLEAEHLPNRSDSWYNRTDRGSVDLAAPNPCLLLRIWLVYMPPVCWLLPMATFGECHKFQAFPVSLEAEHLPNRSDSWYNRTDRGSVDLAAPNPCLLLRIWLVYMPPVRWLLPMATFGECHKFQAFPVSLEAEHLPNRSDSWYNRTDLGSVDLAAPNPCLLLRIWLVYMPPVRWLLPMATFGECHKFQAFPVSLEAEHLPNRSDSWYNRTDRGSVGYHADSEALLRSLWRSPARVSFAVDAPLPLEWCSR